MTAPSTVRFPLARTGRKVVLDVTVATVLSLVKPFGRIRDRRRGLPSGG